MLCCVVAMAPQLRRHSNDGMPRLLTGCAGLTCRDARTTQRARAIQQELIPPLIIFYSKEIHHGRIGLAEGQPAISSPHRSSEEQCQLRKRGERSRRTRSRKPSPPALPVGQVHDYWSVTTADSLWTDYRNRQRVLQNRSGLHIHHDGAGAHAKHQPISLPHHMIRPMTS